MKNEVEKPRHSGQGAITDHSDLIERLRHADQHSQQRMLGSGIFGEAASALSSQSLSLSEAREALNSFQDEVWGSFDGWSKSLGWGLTGIQPECFAMMDASVRELVEARKQLAAISAAIGSARFMDPPDGGDVSVSEQVDRMRLALENAERALEPFAVMDATKFVGSIYETADDDMVVLFNHASGVKIYRGDFRRARSALENGPAVLADATNDPASLSSLRKGAEVVGEAAAYDFVAAWHERQAKLFREMAEDDPRTAKPARDRAKEAAIHHAASAAALRNRAADDRRAALVSGSREEQS